MTGGHTLFLGKNAAVEVIRLLFGLLYIGSPAPPDTEVDHDHAYQHGNDEAKSRQYHTYGHVPLDAQLFKGCASSSGSSVAAVEGEYTHDAPAIGKAGPDLL